MENGVWFKDIRHGMNIYIYIEFYAESIIWCYGESRMGKMINLAGVWRSLFLDKAWSMLIGQS